MSIYPALSHGGTIPASGGEAAYVSMLIARPDKQCPISLAAFRRIEWDSSATNALYGAFASVCATTDLKRWIQTFCKGVSAAQISGYVSGGLINADFGNRMSPNALASLKVRIGVLKSYIVQNELVHGDSIQLVGIATGSAGSATISAQFGPNGRLDGFRIQ